MADPSTTFPWMTALTVINSLMTTVVFFWLKKTGSFEDKRKADIDVQEGFAEVADAHKSRADWAERKAGAEEKKRKQAEADLLKATMDMHEKLRLQEADLQAVKNQVLVLETKIKIIESHKDNIEFAYEESLKREAEKDQKIKELSDSINDMEANWQADKIRLMEKDRIIAELRGLE